MYSDNWNYATEAVKSDDFSSDFSQAAALDPSSRWQLSCSLPGFRTQRRVLHSEHPPKYSNPFDL